MKKDPYAPLRSQMQETPTHWRSLEHLGGDSSVTETQDMEFPNGAAPSTGYSRRDALKLAGASLSLGALAGCDKLPIRRPVEEILPFVRAPEQAIPGVRMTYATAMQRSQGAVGLLVKANEGRPTKIEGNPEHPSSLGASDIWAQAEVLRLYDPERARTPLKGGVASTWADFDAAMAALPADGAGVALLAEDDLGPTGERLLSAFLAKRPQAKVFRWDPTAADQAQLGAALAFGDGSRVHHDLEKVSVVFALDSDFLVSGPDHLKLARQFGQSRAVESPSDARKMIRLYAAEAAFSITGSNADHRVRVPSSQAGDVLRALAAELRTQGVNTPDVVATTALTETVQKFVKALAKDLAGARGAAALFVGERQPAAIHALAHAINAALGGGIKVSTSPRPGARSAMGEQLRALTEALNQGSVSTLVLLDTNPVYTAPGALKFAEALAKAKTSIHCGVLPEETGLKASWHAPLAHFLESWGDAAAWDGTSSLVQPLILPLHGGRPLATVLAQLAGEAETSDRKQVELTWRSEGGKLADNKAWRKALHDGVIAGTARPLSEPVAKVIEVAAAARAVQATVPGKDAYEFVVVQGHGLDGRLANVSWVMELPDTMSKLVWDNAVLLAPTTAAELGIQSKVDRNGYAADVVELSANGVTVQAPAFVLPGLNPTSLVMVQGYGRTAGAVAKDVGVSASALLADGLGVVTGVKLTRTGKSQVLCSTQDHFSVPGNPYKELTFADMTKMAAGAPERALGLGTRPHYRSGTTAEFEAKPAFAQEQDISGKFGLVELKLPGKSAAAPVSLTQPDAPIKYDGQQWGMVVDLSSCIGCNVCAVACQAENNIPNVGREQVLLGREMHWIRVDRYFTGDVDTPSSVHQPVGCQHCENAPCEPVCPVSATVHDEEGLNSMAYNRCIGTRYCANNCPFKVRRFNYLDFTKTGNVYVPEEDKERMKTLKLQRNPDVTVRYRGVMEKCTYCTQRVEEAKISTKRDGGDRKALPDGAVKPACAQACPTQAITFGNINDAQSRVHALKTNPRNYELLQELNVRPRTSYLARVRNENKDLT
jgi:MoCo/4Fe-4S cofactor protein with predicted Tat translocation signal